MHSPKRHWNHQELETATRLIACEMCVVFRVLLGLKKHVRNNPYKQGRNNTKLEDVNSATHVS